MKKGIKNIIALIIVFVMLLSNFSVCGLDFTVNASAIEYSGYCGSSITSSEVKWKFSNGKLTISGSGYIGDGYSGWDSIKEQITSVEIKYGVRRIGKYAFRRFTNMKYIIIPGSVNYIKSGVFYECQNLKYVIYLGGKAGWNQINNYEKSNLANKTIIYRDNSIQCGRNAYGYFDNGKLMVYGDGEISSYTVWSNIRSSVESIEIFDGITSISNFSFKDFTKLKSVAIPISVIGISNGVFSGCKNLKYVFYTGDKTAWNRISNYDKDNLANKTIIYIASSVQCGQNAYGSFDNGKLTVFGDGAISSYYTVWNSIKDSVESIDILDGITHIGNSAFMSFTKLKSVTISDSVINIGQTAFAGCTSLTNITIPDRVTSINSGAFSNCTGLTNITIPDRVTSISGGAFYNCTGLANISIPESVRYIGLNAFYNVLNINYSSDWYSNVMNGQGSPWGALAVNRYAEGYLIYENSLKQKIVSCNPSARGEIVIPEGVTSIEASAFNGCRGLTNVTIPDSVTSIGASAFSGCRGMTSITIPDSVTSIGDNAFENCIGLKSIRISEKIKRIGYRTFYNCTGLTSVTIPDSVTSIGDYAFSGCFGLTSITIPNSVTSIGLYAFSGCTGLTSVTIPNSVTSIGDYAFSGCFGLTNVTIPDSVTSIGFFAFSGVNNIVYSTKKMIATGSPWGAKVANGFIDGDLIYENKAKRKVCGFNTELSGELIIPDTVTDIDNNAFYGCKKITNVIIPNSVNTIGMSAFGGCTGLTSIIIPDGVTNIYSGAFNYCIGLKSIIIPDSVTIISYGMFLNCTSLTSIDIPDTVTRIWGNAFSGCTSLTSITIPGKVTVIADGAFSNCTGLTNVTIPNSVINIGDHAFSNCTGLTSITVPDSVTSIGESAFENINNVFYSANMTATGSPWGAKVANGYVDKETGLIYTDSSMKELVGCSTVATGKISIPSSVETIRDKAFYDCRKIEKLTIPLNSNLSLIGDMAFYGVNNIAYPDSWYKEKMNSTGSPWGAKAVDAYVENGFYYFDASKELLLGCSSLMSGEVTVPETVEEIGDMCFYGCNEITTLSVRSSEIVFSDTAFVGCDNLQNVYSINTIDGVTYNTAFDNSEGAENLGILFCNRDKTNDFTVPQGVKFIGEKAFAECKDVAVSFDENVELRRIGKNAFFESEDYFNESKWSNGMLILGKYLVAAKENVPATLNLKDDVVLVADSVFSECKSLEKFVGGSGLKYIGDYVFSGTKIKSSNEINLKNSTKIKYVGKNIILSQETENDGSRETVYCGNTLLSVSKNVKNFTVDSGTTCIAAGAFKGCDFVTDVALPDSVTDIAEDTFFGCINLRRINLHNNIESIGRNAFRDCYSLTSVSIPSSVSVIGELAFNGCKSVTRFTADDNKYFSADDGVLFNKDKTVLIQYPCAKEYVEEYTVNNSVRICDFAFQWCNNIKKIIIGNNVIFGNRNPFANCNALYAIGGETSQIVLTDSGETLVSVSGSYSGPLEIPRTVCKIGESAAKGCTGITSVIIPELVDTIGESAFENCTNLKTVTFENNNGMTYNDVLGFIGDFAFCNCPCNDVSAGGTCNKEILKAEDISISKTAFHNHSGDEWNKGTVTSEPTVSTIGKKERYCSECKKTEIEILPKFVSFVDDVFYEGNMVFGFSSLPLDSDMFINTNYDNISANINKEKIGTDTVVSISKDGINIQDLTVVIFGDLSGDGWYDGTDAVIVNCLLAGMLTQNDLSEAQYMAADCNHDGTIDKHDVDILNQAGLLFANVDQSKSKEELQTDSNYIEYLNLIDQNPNNDNPADNPVDESNDEPIEKTTFFQRLIKFIVKIFNFFKLNFSIIK